MSSAPAPAAAPGLPKTNVATQLGWVMAFLDDRGATFEALGGNRFAARYRLAGGEPKYWICTDDPSDVEQAFARAFPLRIDRERGQ